jgi:hypothetical protein
MLNTSGKRENCADVVKAVLAKGKDIHLSELSDILSNVDREDRIVVVSACLNNADFTGYGIDFMLIETSELERLKEEERNYYDLKVFTKLGALIVILITLTWLFDCSGGGYGRYKADVYEGGADY